MVTNNEQLILNAKGKDLPRETRMELECTCQYIMYFPITLLPCNLGTKECLTTTYHVWSHVGL